MGTLALMNGAVVSALRTEQIGRAVSLRAFLQLSSDHGHLETIATQAIAQAAAWFDAPAVSVYSLGGAESGQLTTLVEYKAGQTALVTVAILAASDAPVTDVLVIGNHGTLIWDGPGNADIDVGPYEPPALDDDGPAVRSAIRQSLSTSGPVTVSQGT